MKIVLLSDIHGNDIALDAVLKEIKDQNISHYIVAGDHISDCPGPIKVIDKLIELNAYLIKGNREQYIIDYINSGKDSWNTYDQMQSIEWTRKQLREKDLLWLNSLDSQKSIEFKDKDSIRVVHGSTKSMFEHLYKENEDRLIEVLSNIDEEVLICGHSHQPWNIRLNNKLIVNPGSVGVSFNNRVSADYAILSWNNCRWEVKHCSAPYSLDELYNSYIKSGLYNEGGIWSKLILQSLKDGKNRNIDFINRALYYKTDLDNRESNYISNNIWRKTVESWSFN